MTNLFENNRNYVLGDDELNLIGDRDKLAQWRHKGMGPAFWSCPVCVPVSQLIYAAFRSNAKGLLPPNDEWRRRGL
jgi:hypothetical protein